MATSATVSKFQYVEEAGDAFLSLFPHRYDYIYANYPEPGEKPDWKTESRYPLPDRLIQQAEGLFGVRFGKQTCYCLLDIDITSAYHPRRDAFAISNLAAALEPLGLVSYVACTSSYSNGIHLYFPFSHPQSSWEVAAAVTALLDKAGFKLAPGQLELFPNPRPYVAGNPPSLFHAHRLPLQIGSYLLNADFQPVWGDRLTFVEQWQLSQSCNDLDVKLLKQLVRVRPKTQPVSGKAEKFLADLNAEITAGWTGCGQTNHLLGRIAMRSYVFHHILFGGEPLTGQALINDIVATARSLPGYQVWCQHQQDIEKRAAEWARCVEGSRYFPYGSRRSSAALLTPGTTEATDSSCSTDGLSSTWNQQQSENVRERIRQALAHLLETNTLPAAITARFQALTQFGIGGSSLYRHRDLWHPSYLVENPPDPPALIDCETLDSAEGASNVPNSTSLFPVTARNSLSHKACKRSIDLIPAPGCNSSNLVFSSARSRSQLPLALDQRMQQFLDSGDAILMTEALSYFRSRDDRQRVSSTLPELQPVGFVGCGLQERRATEFSTRVDLNCRVQSGEVRWSEVSSAELPPENLSHLLATITIEIRRLGWTREQVTQYLWQQFGKSQQSRLSRNELVEWLEWLRASKFPAGTG